MRASGLVGVVTSVGVVVLGAGAAAAQSAMAQPIQIAVACGAPAMSDEKMEHALHVIGAQGSLARTAFDNRDLLVIDGGTAAGVQLGQEFYVRGNARLWALPYAGVKAPPSIRTGGWVRIVAANERTSIAQITHACGVIFQGDYLEPYKEPSIPAGADRDEATGDPDFTALGHILSGPLDRRNAVMGEFVLIDRGSEQGIAAGARFAVYRDVAMAGMPLASIGELVVVDVGKDQALARVTRSRDAIETGDYVAPRK